ncbi:TonB-dependent receptor domain-containing protein [Massilia consociata]|uniref:TonB-dependent receptor domain-containing protein n=1 Tax=Massilia consociata TaxID=760117 RepID=A0ABV6FGK4_9BURK
MSKQQQLVVKRSVIAVAVALAGSNAAFAQQAAQQVPTAAPVQKVYVTGSNIKRADKEGSSPVATLNAKQIAATGANTVSELLHSIPAFGSGTSNDIMDGSFSKGASTASLRGLGSSSTLVLLNGRRITASAYADPNQGKSAVYDLNTIPVSAIERVEIFKDGASAVYGSDAIAGVINFITKSNYQGKELTASASANDNLEFARRNVSGVLGFGDLDEDRYNAFFSFDIASRDRTAIRDARDVKQHMYADINARLNEYGSYVSDQPFFFRERTPGARNFSTTLANSAGIVNRLGCDPANQVTGNRDKHNLSATSILNGRTFCNYDVWNNYESQSKGNDANLLGKLTFQLTPDITAFTELGYTRTEREYTGNSSTILSTSPTTVFRTNGLPSDYQLILPAGHPDNPWTDARAAVGYRFSGINGGSKNVNQSGRFLAGLKGTTGQFDWETAVLLNRSERTETMKGMLYRPTIDRILLENRTLAQTAADPTVARDVVNKGYAQVAQLDAKASTTIGQLAGGDIGLAFGGEIRQEKLSMTPDYQTQTGNILGLANSLVDGSRMVKSAFVEVRTPFTKNFEMDFAGRYDKYPTENSFVPKVGAKFIVNDKLTFRSSYAEGFRAPALSQIAEGGVQSFSTVTDTVRCPDGKNPLPGGDTSDCSRRISSMSKANPDLKPETSKSFSFGAIIAPTKNLDILVDYYKIRKEDETALLSAGYVIDHPDLYPNLAVRDTNPANFLVDANGRPIPGTGPVNAVNRYYVNQGATETSGLDFEVAHRLNLGDNGRLTTKLDWSYALTFKRSERPGEREANVVGTSGGYSDWAITVGDIPRHRASLSTNWTRAAHSVTGSVDFVSPVSLLRRTDNYVTYPVPYCHYGKGQPAGAYSLGGLEKFSNWVSDCSVPEWTTFNVAYAYTGFKNWTLSANIKNLFDTAAPYDPRYSTEGFNTQLHNAMGRYFRVSASYKF